MKERIDIYTDKNGNKTIIYNTILKDKIIEILETSNINRVSFGLGAGEKEPLYELLAFKDKIKSILLNEKISFKYLDNFSELEFLSIPDNKIDIVDLEAFPKLNSLSCYYTSRLVNLDKCINIKSLTLNNYKSKQSNLKILPEFQKLEVLYIFSTNIHSLEGIEKYKRLKRLQIYSAGSLSDINGLSALKDNIESIELDRCKKINSYPILGELSNLRELMIINCNEIENLMFAKTLINLKTLVIMGTKIREISEEYYNHVDRVTIKSKKFPMWI